MNGSHEAVDEMIDSLDVTEPEGDVVKEISERFLDDQDKMRHQLLEAMSGWSEQMTCASWIIELDRRLHKEEGIWQLIAAETGWPVDVGAGLGVENFRWLTWEEAGEVYKHPTGEAAKWAAEAEAHGLNAEGHLKDCGA